ncbi:hypothetical protein ABZ746_38735 [Streptomyces sp. NPDC020096]
MAAFIVVMVVIAVANSDSSSKGGSSTAKSGTSQGPSEPVPQELRDLDVAAGVHASPQPDYDAAFKTLSTRCNEQGVGLGNEVGAVLGLLQKKGVNDENRLTVMQHLAASIPAGTNMGCADIGGAYVTLRTGGQ